MTRVIEIDVKNRTYQFLDDIINVKNLDLNSIKVDEKSYKSYVTPNSAKRLYFIINNANRYIEKSNINFY